jgi:hypothetical protein
VDVRVQYAHCTTRFGEGYGKIHGYSAFSNAAFAAYDGYFVLDLAHSGFEELLLFQKFLPADFHHVWRLVCCSQEKHRTDELMSRGLKRVSSFCWG